MLRYFSWVRKRLQTSKKQKHISPFKPQQKNISETGFLLDYILQCIVTVNIMSLYVNRISFWYHNTKSERGYWEKTSFIWVIHQKVFTKMSKQYYWKLDKACMIIQKKLYRQNNSKSRSISDRCGINNEYHPSRDQEDPSLFSLLQGKESSGGGYIEHAISIYQSIMILHLSNMPKNFLLSIYLSIYLSLQVVFFID